MAWASARRRGDESLSAVSADRGEGLRPTAPAAAGDGRGPRVLWGAAAAALIGSVAAYAYRRRRARREQEARILAEIARLNALQRAREAAWRQAAATARRAREAAAQAAQRSRRWLAWLAVEAAASAEAARRAAHAWQDRWRRTLKRERSPPPETPPIDTASWKRHDMAQVDRPIEQKRRAAHRLFRAHERARKGEGAARVTRRPT